MPAPSLGACDDSESDDVPYMWRSSLPRALSLGQGQGLRVRVMCGVLLCAVVVSLPWTLRPLSGLRLRLDEGVACVDVLLDDRGGLVCIKWGS